MKVLRQNFVYWYPTLDFWSVVLVVRFEFLNCLLLVVTNGLFFQLKKN